MMIHSYSFHNTHKPITLPLYAVHKKVLTGEEVSWTNTIDFEKQQ